MYALPLRFYHATYLHPTIRPSEYTYCILNIWTLRVKLVRLNSIVYYRLQADSDSQTQVEGTGTDITDKKLQQGYYLALPYLCTPRNGNESFHK